MRTPLIAGNWKMGVTRKWEARELVSTIRRELASFDGNDILLCPPYIYLEEVARGIEGTPIRLGAQDVHWEPKGAFTGEISVPMLRDLGCQYVIIGHSERRHGMGESDESVARKLRASLDGGLRPVLCVGETLLEREGGRTAEVVLRQLRTALEGWKPEEISGVAIAYEPVWAIGTGRTATPAQAADVHRLLRRTIAEAASSAVAQSARILYGGSVKPDSIEGLLAEAEIDGALVGGASVDAGAFVAIARTRKAVK